MRLKTEWKKTRSFAEELKGQYRWDCAYQLLTDWMQKSAQGTPEVPYQKEDNYAGSIIRSSIIEPATTSPNDRTTD